MYSFKHPFAVSTRWSAAWVMLVLVAALVFAVPAMHAQSSAATLDGVVALFVQNVEIELRASRFSEEKSAQESDGDVAIGAAFAHDVLAGKLLDGAILAVLRPCRRNRAGQKDRGAKNGRAVSWFHFC